MLVILIKTIVLNFQLLSFWIKILTELLVKKKCAFDIFFNSTKLYFILFVLYFISELYQLMKTIVIVLFYNINSSDSLHNSKNSRLFSYFVW